MRTARRSAPEHQMLFPTSSLRLARTWSASAAGPSQQDMNFGYAAIMIQLHAFHVEMPFAAAVLETTYEHLLNFGLPFHGRTCVRDTELLILVQGRLPQRGFWAGGARIVHWRMAP